MKRKEEREKRRERKGGERGTSGSGRRIIQNTECGGPVSFTVGWAFEASIQFYHYSYTWLGMRAFGPTLSVTT